MNPTVLTERHGRVLLITLNRPEVMNALDPASMRALRNTLTEFRDDNALDVAVVTGSGDRAFCTGADLRATKDASKPFIAAQLADLTGAIEDGAYVRALMFDDLQIQKPLIAAINGHALGGGLELALQCDLRICTENATFGLPEARWASVPGAGGVSMLTRAVPSAIAMKMALTGDRIDAATALQVGLVSDVVAAGDALQLGIEIAERISRNGPLAVRAITSLARRTHELGLRQSMAFEQLTWGLLRDTADRIEGRLAFGDRRDPDYHGM